jgi:hypothetical protein
MPKEFSVHLSKYEVNTITAATDQTLYAYGILECLNKRPLFMTELYTIYKYCRFTMAEIEVEVANTGATGVQLVLGHAPYSDLSGLTFSRLVQNPQSIRRTASVSGGMDRVILRKAYNGMQLVGNPAFTRQLWIDAAQSASASPVNTDLPVIAMIADNLVGGTTAYSLSLNIKVTWHLQWFDLEVPSES